MNPKATTVRIWWRKRRYVLGGLLGLAALTKLADPAAALRVIGELLPVTGSRQQLLLALVIGIELVVAAELMVGAQVEWALKLAGAVFGTFLAVSIALLINGHTGGCGCFGKNTELGGWGLILRNTLLCLLCFDLPRPFARHAPCAAA